MADLAKAAVADSVDQQQVLGPSERTVLFAKFDYLQSELFTDVRDPTKFINPGRVDVYRVGGCFDLKNRAARLLRGAG